MGTSALAGLRRRRRSVAVAAVVAVTGLLAPMAATASAAPTAVPAAVARGPVQQLADAIVRAGAPGALLVVERGARTTAVTAGVADRINGAPLRLADRYRIASQTKTFIATVVLQLVGEGRVALDAPVSRYLPGLVRNGNHITVRMLLDHRSGLYDTQYTLIHSAADLLAPRNRTFTPRRLVELANAHGPNFAPGTSWSYSNTNFVVLGLLISAVTHHTVRSELQRRIFRPLHLTATSLPYDEETIPGPYSHGYLPVSASRPYVDVTRFDPSFLWTSGAAISSQADLNRFQDALFGGRLLDRRLLAAMMRPNNTGEAGYHYGLGLEEYTLPCGTAIGHTGSFPGYASGSFHLADGSAEVRLMMNLNFAPPAVVQRFFLALLGGLCGLSADGAAEALARSGPGVARTISLR